NVAPTVSLTGPPTGSVYAVGTPVTFTGTFTDAGTPDTHTAQWMFDASSVAGTVTQGSGSGSVSNTYTFTTPGVYRVQLTVTDDDGGAGTATTINTTGSALDALVVLYDPNGGIVTGGGWIHSPAGAYTADPNLTGKANFGFVSKYRPGATTPSSQTEFQFKAGNLNFHCSSYEWLVVSGAKARFRGTGTVNGASGYSFELTAWDGQATGGGGVDRFRIKIWQGNQGNAVVYDNQLGAPDGADPTTALGGGSIVIHTAGLQAPGEVGQGEANSETLTPAELQPIAAEAIVRWQAAGIAPESLSALSRLQVQITNLPGSYVGLASSQVIWIDTNAAGYGWFVDPTPEDDQEFWASGDNPVRRRLDLLTVVAHEMGHVLGFEHSHDNDIMGETLETGVRLMPLAGAFGAREAWASARRLASVCPSGEKATEKILCTWACRTCRGSRRFSSQSISRPSPRAAARVFPSGATTSART
ncbi:MAG: PKD domain-containing protein, partial [Gemmataceae bacterium]|nr:PKD domain-containing protein [Gemmataceae bacterium]